MCFGVLFPEEGLRFVIYRLGLKIKIKFKQKVFEVSMCVLLHEAAHANCHMIENRQIFPPSSKMSNCITSTTRKSYQVIDFVSLISWESLRNVANQTTHAHLPIDKLFLDWWIYPGTWITSFESPLARSLQCNGTQFYIPFNYCCPLIVSFSAEWKKIYCFRLLEVLMIRIFLFKHRVL